MKQKNSFLIPLLILGILFIVVIGSGKDCQCTTDEQCDDSNLCTDDSCNNGECKNTMVECLPNNCQTLIGCDPASGCQYAAKDCNDNNKCTTDSCELPGGCKNELPPGMVCCNPATGEMGASCCGKKAVPANKVCCNQVLESICDANDCCGSDLVGNCKPELSHCCLNPTTGAETGLHCLFEGSCPEVGEDITKCQ